MKKEEYNKAREDHYQDLDGNWKRFNIVDHDKKTSTGRMNKGKSKETLDREKRESEERKKEMLLHNEEQINAILSFPAIYAALPSDDFIQAHLFSEIIIKNNDKVDWDIAILKEICSIDRAFTTKLHQRLVDHYEK